MFGLWYYSLLMEMKALAIYWSLSTVAETVKVARLVTYNQVHPAKGTMYPSSDWLLDNACMVRITISRYRSIGFVSDSFLLPSFQLGLLALFIIFEGAHCVLSYRSTYIPGGLQRVPKRLGAIGEPTLLYATAV